MSERTDLFPKLPDSSDVPMSNWPANKYGSSSWFRPLTPPTVETLASGGVKTEEGISLEQIFRNYARIYKKDHTAELEASAANLAEYTDLSEH